MFKPANHSKHKKPNLLKVEEQFGLFLSALGFDWESDVQMMDTPKRVAKMYVKELFAGCYEDEPKFTVFPNTTKMDEMVVLKRVRILSTCSHHFMPFSGHISIGYIPGEKVCGISKLARVANWFARRPQIQEELTSQIVDFLEKKLQPAGVMVVIEAQHGCMTNRGVNEFNSSMVTSRVTGAFKKPETRQEFLSLIRS